MQLRKAKRPLPIRQWGSGRPIYPLPLLGGGIVLTLAVISSLFFLNSCHCLMEILNGEAVIQPNGSSFGDVTSQNDSLVGG